MKIKCACGQTYNDKNLTKHLNSKHHQEFVEKRYNKNPAKAEKQYQKNKKRADKLGYK